MNKNLAAFGWIGIAMAIFYASSQPYTEQDMREEISSVFDRVPELLIQAMDWISFSYAGKIVSIEALGIGGFIEFFIRKAAHFGAFFLLALFFYAFIRHYVKFDGKSIAIAVLFTIFYAASDELHQMLTGGRTPLVQDICLDVVGGICGVALGYFLMNLYKKRHPNIL